MIGVDLSPSSRLALELARSLAAPGARLHLVHATEVRPFELVNAAAALEAEKLHEELSRRARTELDAIAQELGRAGFVVEVTIGAGRAADELVASSSGADLAVVGSHGHGALGRILLGSVAEELLRRSAIPALVVRGAPGTPKRVVVALDPLGPARDAIRAAADLARRTGARLETIHSVHFPALMPTGAITSVGADDDPALARAREVLRGHLESVPARIHALVRDVTGVDAPVHVLAGRPGDEIPRHLRPDDLLVCGTHGRSGAARFFFGSVAGKLVRHAPCSVLVIPPREATPAPAAAPARATTHAG